MEKTVLQRYGDQEKFFTSFTESEILPLFPYKLHSAMLHKCTKKMAYGYGNGRGHKRTKLNVSHIQYIYIYIEFIASMIYLQLTLSNSLSLACPENFALAAFMPR